MDERRAIDRHEQSEEINGDPLHLGDVRVVGSLGDVNRRKGEDQAGDERATMRQPQVTRQRVRPKRGKWKRRQDDDVVGGHRPEHS